MTTKKGPMLNLLSFPITSNRVFLIAFLSINVIDKIPQLSSSKNYARESIVKRIHTE